MDERSIANLVLGVVGFVMGGPVAVWFYLRDEATRDVWWVPAGLSLIPFVCVVTTLIDTEVWAMVVSDDKVLVTWTLLLWLAAAVAGAALGSVVFRYLAQRPDKVKVARVAGAWALFNVSAYLLLWFVHVWLFNVGHTDNGRLDWIGEGPDMWPVGVAPGAAALQVAVNLVVLAAWLVPDGD